MTDATGGLTSGLAGNGVGNGDSDGRQGGAVGDTEAATGTAGGIKAFFNDHPDLRFVFTGGKGGVGKTVAAAAIGLHHARLGKRVLIASLNPVHSLSSVFAQDLGGGKPRPVRGALDNGSGDLHAVELETSEVVRRYRDQIATRVREFLKWADIPVNAKPFVDIAVTNPAFEESAMFDRMVDVILDEGTTDGGPSGGYDVVVFDTAAVANAVRLIGLSKIYGLWLGRMIESRKEALSLKVQLAFRQEKVMEEVKKDPLIGDLLAMNQRFTRVKDILIDAERTAFFFVTLPLALPIAVVRRFIAMVGEYDIPVGGVLVNEVLDAALVGGGDEYLANKVSEQRGYLTEIDRDLGGLVRGFLPLYPSEVDGPDDVTRAADDLLSYEPPLWREVTARS
jgi:arsenite/tail-anchored protein-transporting ATPase